MKYLLFVGAGAEVGYYLPGGADYIVGSVLTKRDIMYENLSEYYSKRHFCEDEISYRRSYILGKNDSVLNHIVQEAVWNLVKDQDNDNARAKIKELKNIQ